MSDDTSGHQITVTKDGPYVVKGDIPLARMTIVADAEGGSESWRQGEAVAHRETYFLCRCGASGTKPFCDGSHARIGFDGTETASRAPYGEQAKTIPGPALSLTDADALCASARFCDPHGKVWNQVHETDQPAIAERFLRQVNACPSGRLVAWDNRTGKPIEETLPASIGLVEDPAENCAGPLWLRGGVPVVAADGAAYEVRNRVTLCRCGASANKPFCDGSHITVGFKDT
jgi:CDGSH-type Zn-finger protein